MNDKKFIEELKFKREEYGVSQKRLAVACDISRVLWYTKVVTFRSDKIE